MTKIANIKAPISQFPEIVRRARFPVVVKRILVPHDLTETTDRWRVGVPASERNRPFEPCCGRANARARRSLLRRRMVHRPTILGELHLRDRGCLRWKRSGNGSYGLNFVTGRQVEI